MFIAALLAGATFDSPESKAAFTLVMFALFFLAYAAHQASLGWIEISPDSQDIAGVPSWFSRILSRQQRTTARILPASELLLCKHVSYGAFDGYAAVLRGTDGPEKTLLTLTIRSGVSRKHWSRIARTLGDQYGINAHPVIRTLYTQGKKEREWTGQTEVTAWNRAVEKIGLSRVILLIGCVLSPWLGIGGRLLTAKPLGLTLFGILLYATSVGVLWHFYRSQAGRKNGSVGVARTIAVWTFEFVIFYVIAILVTGGIVGR
jgi:hypothetical protein